jgi:sortase A
VIGTMQTRRTIRVIEAMLLVASVLLIGTYLAATGYGCIASRISVYQFDQLKEENRIEDRASAETPSRREVDFAGWSKNRIRGYSESLSNQFAPPLAVVSVPQLRIRVAVFDGTDELTLNRGVGWIPGTAHPGTQGNVAIAGHRDGFFRALKDIKLGDEIRLETTTGSFLYHVDHLEIVSPQEIRVLRNREVDSLTLVTCYPFLFVGDAPQRFIVQARLQPAPDNRK